MPPVAQTSGENLFMSSGNIAAVSAVRFSLWLCSPMAVILRHPAGDLHPLLT